MRIWVKPNSYDRLLKAVHEHIDVSSMRKANFLRLSPFGDCWTVIEEILLEGIGAEEIPIKLVIVVLAVLASLKKDRKQACIYPILVAQQVVVVAVISERQNVEDIYIWRVEIITIYLFD